MKSRHNRPSRYSVSEREALRDIMMLATGFGIGLVAAVMAYHWDSINSWLSRNPLVAVLMGAVISVVSYLLSRRSEKALRGTKG